MARSEASRRGSHHVGAQRASEINWKWRPSEREDAWRGKGVYGLKVRLRFVSGYCVCLGYRGRKVHKARADGVSATMLFPTKQAAAFAREEASKAFA